VAVSNTNNNLASLLCDVSFECISDEFVDIC
jgi:hypothetical protein